MADEQTATQVDVQNPQEAYNQELSQAMAFALGNPDSTQLPAAPQQNVNDANQALGAETETNAISNPFDSLKEKFGYQSQEDAIAEIEQLRQLKSNPPKQEFSFDNDDSRKLFDAIKTGDRKGVLAILEQQEKLEAYTSAEITEANADEIIKMGMQVKYKDLNLTPQEIDYKFKKQFSLPKEPIQETLEEDDDFANRKAEWQEQVNSIKMEKIIEAKLLKPELQSAKSKISLPNISDDSQPDYKAWLQQQQADEEADRVTAEAYKKFAPKDAATKMNFNDEANKISFEFQYEPDADSFTKTIETLVDFPTFLNGYKLQDGSPDRQRFLRDMYNGRNIDKIVLSAMNQAKNATIKALALADNTGSGILRELPQHEAETELDSWMKMAGVKR